MNYWLCKQEPSTYNIDNLQREKTTVWDNVHNNLAIKYINQMKKDDLAFFYHTGNERQIVGIMEIISDPYSNPKEKNSRYVVVDVKFKKRLDKPVTLNEIKNHKTFKDWELLRISRLSVMPVSTQNWNEVIKISKKENRQ